MEYQIQHRPPGPGYHGAPLHALDEAIPDVYTHAQQYYGPVSEESVRAIMAARGERNAAATMYRSVPPGVTEINPGDWVTLSQEYAEAHSWSEDGWVVLRASAAAGELWGCADSLEEFGYHGPKAVRAEQLT